MKKSLKITVATVAILGLGIGGAFLVKELFFNKKSPKQEVNNDSFLVKNYKETTSLLFSPNRPIKMNDKEFGTLYGLNYFVKNELNNQEFNAQSFNNHLSNFQNAVLSYTVNSFNRLLKTNSVTQEQKDYLVKLLNLQKQRLTESDLLNQFINDDYIDLDIFFNQFFYTNTINQNQAFLNNFQEQLKKYLDKQNDTINQLFNQDNGINDSIYFVNNLPTVALKEQKGQYLAQALNLLASKSFRFNDIEQLNAKTQALINNYNSFNDQTDSTLSVEINHSISNLNNNLNKLTKNVYLNHLNNASAVLNTLINKNNADQTEFIKLLNNSLKDDQISLENLKDLQNSVSYFVDINPNIKTQFYKQVSLNAINEINQFNNKVNDQLQLVTTVNQINKLNDLVVNRSSNNDDNQKTIEQIKTSLQDFVNANKTYFEQHHAIDVFNQILNDNNYIQVIKDSYSESNTANNNLKPKSSLINIKDNIVSLISLAKNKLDLVLDLVNKVENAKNNNLINQPESLLLTKFAQSNLANLESKETTIDQYLSLKQQFDSINTFIDSLVNEFTNNIFQPFLSSDLRSKLNILKQKVADSKNNTYLKANNIQALNNNELTNLLNVEVISLREQFRSIQKEELTNLVNESLTRFNNFNQDELELFKEVLNNLNKDSLVMIANFSTTDSFTLADQIIKYKQLANKIKGIKEYSKLTHSINQTEADLENIFNDFSNPNYVPSNLEDTQLDKIKALKIEAEQIKQVIQSGKDLDTKTLDKAKEITNQLQHLTQIAPAVNDYNNIASKLQDNINSILNSEEYKNAAEFNPRLKNELDQLIKQTQDQIATAKDIFSKNDLTNDQIANQSKLLQSLADQINTKKANLNTASGLDTLEQAINQAYPKNSNPSRGEQAIRNKFKQLKEIAKNPNLTKEQKAQLANQIEDLTNAIDVVKQIENQVQITNNNLNDLTSSPKNQFVANRTNAEIDVVNQALNQALNQLDNYGLNDVLANNALSSKDLKNTLDQLKKDNDNLSLAYAKDKLNKLNDNLQANAIVNPTTTAQQEFNKQLEAINQNVNANLESTNTDSINNKSDVVAKQNDLANLLKEAIDNANGFENVQPEIQKYLENSVLANNLNPLDTTNAVDNKIANMQNAINAANAMDDFASTYDQLNNILTPEQAEKMYLNDVDQQIKQLLENQKVYLNANYVQQNNLTQAQIEQANTQLNNKIEQLKAQRDALIAQFNADIKEVENTIVSLDTKAISNDPRDKFDNYLKVKAEFDAIKNDNNTTSSDLLAYKQKLQQALEKDKTLNKLASIQRILNASDFGSSPEHEQIKQSTALFVDFVNQQVNNPNISLKDLQALQDKIDSESQLLVQQKLVADYIASRSNSHESEVEKQLANLRAAITKSLPSSTNQYSDLDTRFTELKNDYAAEGKLIALKDSNRSQIEFKVDNKNEAGLKRIFETALVGDDIDPEANTIITKALDDILEQNKNADTLAKAQKISETINDIYNNKNLIVDLSKHVKAAKDTLNNTTNATSAVVQDLKDKLNAKILEAQKAYISDSNNSLELKQLAISIDQLNEQLTKTASLELEINNLVAQINQIDFFVNNGLLGTQKRDEFAKWVNDILLDAINANNFTLDQLLARTTKVQLLINELKLVEAQINDWYQAKSDTKYIGYETDINALIAKMWLAVPTVGFKNDQNNADIINKTQQLTNQLANAKAVNAQRIELFNKIKEFTTDNIQPIKDTYPSLYNSLTNRLNAISMIVDNESSASVIADQETKINTLNNIYNDLTSLATTVETVSAKINTIQPISADVSELKSNLQIKLNAVNNIYLTAVNNNVILDEINNLNFLLTKLDIYHQISVFGEEIKNDKKLTNDEKEVVRTKYNQAKAEIDAIGPTTINPEQVFKTIYDKYFDQNSSSENTISNIFQQTKMLREVINKANTYLLMQKIADESYLDSANTKAIYAQLQTEVQNAVNINKDINSSLVLKQNEINILNDKINQLIDSKISDANILATKMNALHTYVTNNLSANANLITQEYTEAINSLNINETEKNNLDFIKNLNDNIAKAFSVYANAIQALYQTQTRDLNNNLNNLNNYIDEFANPNNRLNDDENTLYNKLIQIKNSFNNFSDFDKDDYKNYNQDPDQQFQNQVLKVIATQISNIDTEIEAFNQKVKADLEVIVNEMHAFNTALTTNDAALATNLSNLSILYNAGLKNNINTLNTELDGVKTSKVASVIKNFVAKVNSAKTNLINLINNIKSNIASTISNRSSLQEIFNELYKANQSVASHSNVLDKLISDYNQVLNDASNINSQLNTTFSDQNKNNLVDSINKFNTFVNWINTEDAKNDFLAQLNVEQNSKPRYQLITPKASTTMEDFINTINSLSTTNDTQLEITTTDAFLKLFDQFAFTQIDNDSVFNPINLKVYIVKTNNDWVTNLSTNENTGTKSASFKLKYVYTPNGLNTFTNLNTIQTEYEINNLSFNTLSTVELPVNSNTIFFNGNNIGYATKQPVLNTTLAGWNDNISNENAIAKMKEIIKTVVLNNRKEIVIDWNTITEDQMQTLDTLIKIQPQTSYILSAYLQLSVDSNKQKLKIWFDDATNELVIAQVSPASITGVPATTTNEQASWVTNSRVFVKNNDGTYDVSKTMPAAVLNLFRFAFEYDSTKKQLYMYNNWYQGFTVIRNRLSLKAENPAVESETPDNFAMYLIQNTDKWVKTTPTYGLDGTSLNTETDDKTKPDHSTAGDESRYPQQIADHTYGYINAYSRSDAVYVYRDQNYPKSTHLNTDKTKVLYDLNALNPAVTLYNTGINYFKFKTRK